ncbi:MAG: GxxExxY protein [Verrucomicrobia bacterium]|nr:GxxExxY protein [Verrucomicrobiota bacterium]
MHSTTSSDNTLTHLVIGRAIEVHRHLGPGLLESAYEECLAYEFSQAGLQFIRQQTLPIRYKEVSLDCGYRLDFLIAGEVIIEVKAVAELLPIHEAQLLTYLKVSGCPLGLLVNFNVPILTQGIRRLIHTPTPPKPDL